MQPFINGWSVHSLCVAAAAALGMLVVFYAAQLVGIPRWRVLTMEVGALLSGLVGARCHAIWESQRSITVERIFTGTSFRYPGGLLATVVALVLLRVVVLKRARVASLLDANAPAIAAAMAIVRVGCLFHGCCYGIRSELPWAIHFPVGSIAWRDQLSAGLLSVDATQSLAVHPLQMYFALWSLAVAIYLLRTLRQRTPPGDVACRFLVLHEGGKGLLEYLRSPALIPHIQIPSAVLAGVGLTAIAIREIRHLFVLPKHAVKGAAVGDWDAVIARKGLS